MTETNGTDGALPPAYRVDRSGDGAAIRIIKADGAQIHPDADDSEYCRFLTWQSSQPDVGSCIGFETLRKGIYFAQPGELHDHLKCNAIMLYADDKGGVGITTAGAFPFESELKFYQLHHCVVQKGPEGQGDSVRSQPSSLYVGSNLLQRLADDLTDEDSTTRKLSSLPVNKTFVYVDISDFSKHSAAHQALIINALVKITTDASYWFNSPYGNRSHNELEASLCIGDGYIFVSRRSTSGVLFAAYLARLIESLVARKHVPEFHFRIGVHTGEVYRFWDWGRGGVEADGTTHGDWNYIGDGINIGQRIISAIGSGMDDVVFASAETRQALEGDAEHPAAEMLPHLHNRGRRADKHGVLRRV